MGAGETIGVLVPTSREDVREALEHVSALRAFYIHLTVFALVMALLTTINALSKAGDWWVLWVFGGWGIGVLAHALAVFAPPLKLWGSDWERRKVRQRLGRE
jgi:predicted MFS family arabinose efflux permease